MQPYRSRIRKPRRPCWPGVLLALVAGSAGAAQFEARFVDDSTGDFSERGWLSPTSSFQLNVRAALAAWAAEIDAPGTIRVRVTATRELSRAGGTFALGAALGTTPQGEVFESAPATLLRTGLPVAGDSEILLYFNADYVDRFYWLDPTPSNRGDAPPPEGRTDLVSIVMHEMGHGLGMAGFREFAAGPSYGRLPGVLTVIDQLGVFGGDGNPLAAGGAPNPMFFGGVRADAVYGGPVPLSHVGPLGFLHSQDYYHLGTCGDAPVLVDSLMNGCRVPTDGSVLAITALDRAVIADLGVPMLPDAAVTARQTGFTGTWYDALTSGQGFVLESFANGTVAGGWFTYANEPPGDTRLQRWLYLQGDRVAADGSIELVVYRNTGGRFAQPPATTAVAVGNARLRFRSCERAELGYAFTDGSLPPGRVLLERLAANVACTRDGAGITNADFALSGNWFDPAASGQGVIVELNPVTGLLFATWYTYANDGNGGQRWYSIQLGGDVAGRRSFADVAIYETTGGRFGAPPEATQQTRRIGTATVTFASCSSLVLGYAFTAGDAAGRAGTLSLARVGAVPAGCVD